MWPKHGDNWLDKGKINSKRLNFKPIHYISNDRNLSIYKYNNTLKSDLFRETTDNENSPRFLW